MIRQASVLSSVCFSLVLCATLMQAAIAVAEPAKAGKTIEAIEAIEATVAKAAKVAPPAPMGALPSPRHLAWHDQQFYAFVHFNMNTFSGVEWGHGRETPDRFNPSELDCRQWCKLFKECGLTGVIITAKHHDGFCLWPSRFTKHDVASSPWRNGKGDVVKELAEACKAEGLWLGIYISPWDRNNPIYGRDDAAYNDYFVGQMEELLGNYGPIAEVWWDGANGDRNNPVKHQEYDWARFIKTVRRLQPNAVIFAPPYTPGDVRWVGNERGVAGVTQWSTYPLHTPEKKGPMNVGIEGADGWMPSETDVSIRPGWYWKKQTDNQVKSPSRLLDIYYQSVGRNSNLLLNFPVDARGLVHENDAASLRGMTDILRATFDTDLAAGKSATATKTRGEDFAADKITDGKADTYWAAPDGVVAADVEIDLGGQILFNRLAMQEHIELGQRVRQWQVEARVNGQWQKIAEGTTIGHMRMARFPTVSADRVRLQILDSRACPTIESLRLYVAPPELTIRPDARVFLDKTTVHIETDLPDCEIHYTTDGTQPTIDSTRYADPFSVSESCDLRAIVVRDGKVSPHQSGLELVGYTNQTLQPGVTLPGNLKPGVMMRTYDSGWQTLDQMSERKPVASQARGNFGIHWRELSKHSAVAIETFLTVPEDGMYEFFLSSRDGSRLYIDGKLAIDNDGLHATLEKTGHIGLKAGAHAVRLENFHVSQRAHLQLQWAGPGFTKQGFAGKLLKHSPEPQP